MEKRVGNFALRNFNHSMLFNPLKGVEQFIHGGSNKQDESRWKLFGKMGNTGSIIQEDNSAEHCFFTKELGI